MLSFKPVLFLSLLFLMACTLGWTITARAEAPDIQIACGAQDSLQLRIVLGPQSGHLQLGTWVQTRLQPRYSVIREIKTYGESFYERVGLHGFRAGLVQLRYMATGDVRKRTIFSVEGSLGLEPRGPGEMTVTRLWSLPEGLYPLPAWGLGPCRVTQIED